MSYLYKINNLTEGIIVKRPSKYIKTPYVADVEIVTNNTNNNITDTIENNEIILGHTAALGCCGLADTGATVLIEPILEHKTKHSKKDANSDSTSSSKYHCNYRVHLSIIREKNKEIIIGINPKLAENLTEQALTRNLLSKLQNIKSYRRETKIFIPDLVDSRFDFTGIDENNIPFIMEVKNVPLADYEDVTKTERKKKSYEDRDVNSKVAYFPDGYRKKTTDTVSPRALKHINELTLIKSMSITRCIMCYVIQRTDVTSFQPSIIDPQYREAFKNAVKNGVEIITMVIEWTKEGEAYFIKDDLLINCID